MEEPLQITLDLDLRLAIGARRLQPGEESLLSYIALYSEAVDVTRAALGPIPGSASNGKSEESLERKAVRAAVRKRKAAPRMRRRG